MPYYVLLRYISRSEWRCVLKQLSIKGLVILLVFIRAMTSEISKECGDTRPDTMLTSGCCRRKR